MNIIEQAGIFSKSEYGKDIEELNGNELHNAISKSVMAKISDDWNDSKTKHQSSKCAYYFSAEFLMGRAIYNNLLSLGLTQEVEKQLSELGLSLTMLEDVEDAALGNGGLGRLAACFLESAATMNLPLNGYGIRYKYGLFKQEIENGFQKEFVDDWSKYGDPWSIRCDDDCVTVDFKGLSVKAVPYDMPIIGYNTNNIGTLRLWQCEPIEAFDFERFNNQQYTKSLKDKNVAENISRVLYPNDSAYSGKVLRFRQQYFFTSASLQDIIKKYKKNHSNNFDDFAIFVTIQLNDTHPVIAIPEFIRLMMQNENMEYEKALSLSKKVFNYTNHTIMQEALEKWDMKLIKSVTPDIAQIIIKLNNSLKNELKKLGVPQNVQSKMLIIQNKDKEVHMAYLATFVCSYINGVAQLHTDILKQTVLLDWYKYYGNKFQNKTNGITQRRWLALCNPELSQLITRLLGSDDWIVDLDKLKQLEKYADDDGVIDEFISIKHQKKKQLANHIKIYENTEIDENTIYDIQIKRLHEYKRQLLKILCILELYFEIKEGKVKDLVPTTFIFGAKSAPGYVRAKGIIKLINEVAKLIEEDEEASKYLKVVFVQNYNVSYAEKLVAAADVSEQISTAGTEASGTGNMKLMLNGAVTLGTYDGATVEIVQEAGVENNYIFGATVEEIEKIKDDYDPKAIYESNYKVRRVLDALIDGTLDDGGTKVFKELRSSILKGASWHSPDQYYLLLDFDDYLQTFLKLNEDYKNKKEFAKKQWLNMCNAGKFSSDRTILQYAQDIWHIDKV